jgi:hypothetical protein
MVPPGKYPIFVEDNIITFQIGKRKYSILETPFMNNQTASISCIHDLSSKGKIFPLKEKTGNRFSLGKYAEFEVIVNFNYIEIIERIQSE